MENILIIEDDKNVRNSLIDLLQCSGYYATSAVNGKEAFDMIINKLPDLIISDIMMPELDGIELLKQLRSRPDTSSLPIIFLTAKTEYSDMRTGMNYGADDYILKPFKANEVLQAVEARLNKKNQQIRNFSQIKNNITHRIPNLISIPLLNIAGFTEILYEESEKLTPEEIRSYANRISKSQINLFKIINKYGDYTESIFLVLNPMDYKHLTESKLSLIKNISYQIIFDNPKIKKRKSKLDINIEDIQLKISSYHYQFMLNELIENAVNHSDPGTVIYFKGKRENNNYFLSVKNKGNYFAEEMQECILQHNSMNNNVFNQNFPKLGLVTIKNIMKFYKGSLEIKSDLEGITEVILRFPL